MTRILLALTLAVFGGAAFGQGTDTVLTIGTAPYLTIQTAVSTACQPGATGRWQILIPASATPPDSPGTVTKGCVQAYITDQRITPVATCQWISPAYLCNTGVIPAPPSGNVTAASIAAAIITQTGCNNAGYFWAPATNTCLAASVPLTAAAIAAAIGTQTGCTTAGYVWSPATNTCAASSGTVTAASIAAAISTQTGCASAGYAWSPATNTCAAYDPLGGASAAQTTANAALPRAGGTMTGQLGIYSMPGECFLYADTYTGGGQAAAAQCASKGAGTVYFPNWHGYDALHPNLFTTGLNITGSNETIRGDGIYATDFSGSGIFPDFTLFNESTAAAQLTRVNFSDFTAYGTIAGGLTTPSASLGAGAGTGASAVSVSGNGSNVKVLFTAGSSPASNSVVATVTWPANKWGIVTPFGSVTTNQYPAASLTLTNCQLVATVGSCNISVGTTPLTAGLFYSLAMSMGYGTSPAFLLNSDSSRMDNIACDGPANGCISILATNLASHELLTNIYSLGGAGDGIFSPGGTPSGSGPAFANLGDFTTLQAMGNFMAGYGLYHIVNPGRLQFNRFTDLGSHCESNAMGCNSIDWTNGFTSFGGYSYGIQDTFIGDQSIANAVLRMTTDGAAPHDQGGAYNWVAMTNCNNHLQTIANGGPCALRNNFEQIERHQDFTAVPDGDMSANNLTAWTTGTGASIQKTNYTAQTNGEHFLRQTCSTAPCSVTNTVTDPTAGGGSNNFRIFWNTSDTSNLTVMPCQVQISDGGGTLLVDSGAMRSNGGAFLRNEQFVELNFQNTTATFVVKLIDNSTTTSCNWFHAWDVVNSIANPAMTQGTLGSAPTSWTTGSGCVVANDTARLPGGQSALCISNSPAFQIAQVPNVVLGEYYELSAWLYELPGANPVLLAYGDINSGAQVDGVYFNATAGGAPGQKGVWKKVSYTIRAVSATQRVSLGAIGTSAGYATDISMIHLNQNDQHTHDNFVNASVKNLVVQTCTGCGSGVTSVATTAPLSGGTITTTGTLSCPTCVVATTPGAGLAHFAGGTQTATSSTVALGSADVSGLLPVAKGGTGTATPGITAGTGVSVTGTWPNQTVSATGAGGGGAGFLTGLIDQCMVGTSTALTCLGDALSAATGSTGALSFATATSPAQIQSTSGTTINNGAGFNGQQFGGPYYAARLPNVVFGISYKFTTDYSSNARVWLGLVGSTCTAATMTASDNPACSYAAIRWSTTAGDTTYQCVTGNGTAQTITAIGAAVPSTTFTNMGINIGASGVTCTVGTATAANTATLPASTVNLYDLYLNTTLAAAATHLQINGLYGVAQNGTF